MGALALGASLGLPNVAFIVFDWLVRVLPGGLVVWGLETTLRLLEALGFDIKDTTKTVEVALAQLFVFVPAAIAGLLFFVVVDPRHGARAPGIGRIVGGAVGVSLGFLVLTESAVPTVSVVAGALWVVAVYFAWGWALGRLLLATNPGGEAVATSTLTSTSWVKANWAWVRSSRRLLPWIVTTASDRPSRARIRPSR